MCLGGSSHPGAVGAAVNGAIRLYTVTDDLDAAVLARWGERMDRALEAVEHVWLIAGHFYPKRLVVLVAAHFALGHLCNSSPSPAFANRKACISPTGLIETPAPAREVPLDYLSYSFRPRKLRSLAGGFEADCF